MNRSREYTKIVHTSTIPQETPSCIESPFSELFALDKRIKDRLNDITKCKYEVYNIRSQISEVQGMCKEVLNGLNRINIVYSNNQEEEVYNNVSNILKSRMSEYKLVILSYLRRSEKEEKEKQRRRSKYSAEESDIKSSTPTNSTENMVILMEENGVRMRSQREEISRQISEIGNIMEEIGLHVSLQEESFKRIDDLMKESDKILDSSLYLLKRGVEGVTGTRKSLLKFFIFWIALALIFWMFRR